MNTFNQSETVIVLDIEKLGTLPIFSISKGNVEFRNQIRTPLPHRVSPAFFHSLTLGDSRRKDLGQSPMRLGTVPVLLKVSNTTRDLKI